MHMIAGLLAGFPNFLLYFSVSVILFWRLSSSTSSLRLMMNGI